jgi:hypothetical protein
MVATPDPSLLSLVLLRENFCLNACVLLRRESRVATPDPSLQSLVLLRD